jgi:parallel beta-helix repeat protein
MTRFAALLKSQLVFGLLVTGALSSTLLPARRAQAQTAGTISLVTALSLSPASPGVNQSTTATFTVKNTGGSAITAQAFVAGARNPSNGNVDFPGTGAVTLQPGQQYTYSAARTFTANGSYTAWPSYFDGTNWFQLASPTTFAVGSPANISVVTALSLSPASPAVNQSTTATFTVQNTGGQAITAQAFVTAARDPSSGNVDFPGTAAVTLQPGQQYTYSAARSFTTAGSTYSAWPSWFDGTNWTDLDVHQSFTVSSTGGASCTLPWGGTIADGASVTAYQSSAPTCGSACTSQTRTCSNGTLSGSFGNSSCAPPTGCPGATKIVAQDGSGNYTTISAAAAAAVPGDVIQINDGTYTEHVALVNSGTASASITFVAQHNGSAIITNGSGPCIDLSTASYLKFSGLALNNCNAGAPGIACCSDSELGGAFQATGGSHHIVVDGLFINNSSGSGVYIFGTGQSNNRVHDITVQNSTITNSTNHGIFIYRGADTITADHNTISNSGNGDQNANGYGFEIRDDDGSNLTADGHGPSHIIITNNDAGYSSYQGARTWDVQYVLFQGNHFHHSGATGIQIERNTSFCILDGNTLDNNSWTGHYPSETGIWIDRSTDCVVRNNTRTANDIGIWVGAGNDRILVRNNFSYLNGSPTPGFPKGQNFSEGLRVNGDCCPNVAKSTSSHVTVVHNTLYKNGTTNPDTAGNSFNLMLELGQNPSGSCGCGSGTAGTGNVAYNNIVSDVVGNSANFEVVSGYTVSNGCYWDPAGGAPGDGAAVSQDPQYVNPASANFTLQATSACVDHGAFLTTATAAGTSSTTLTVADARYFIDGYGMTAGDSIMIGSQRATITQVSGNTLTITPALTWAAGAKVTYPYLGAAPDVGAVESH